MICSYSPGSHLNQIQWSCHFVDSGMSWQIGPASEVIKQNSFMFTRVISGESMWLWLYKLRWLINWESYKQNEFTTDRSCKRTNDSTVELLPLETKGVILSSSCSCADFALAARAIARISGLICDFASRFDKWTKISSIGVQPQTWTHSPSSTSWEDIKILWLVVRVRYDAFKLVFK